MLLNARLNIWWKCVAVECSIIVASVNFQIHPLHLLLASFLKQRWQVVHFALYSGLLWCHKVHSHLASTSHNTHCEAFQLFSFAPALNVLSVSKHEKRRVAQLTVNTKLIVLFCCTSIDFRETSTAEADDQRGYSIIIDDSLSINLAIKILRWHAEGKTSDSWID